MSKTVVITGASSGIGAATAKLFAKEGWKVIVGARRVDSLFEVASEAGAEAHVLDVTKVDSVREFCSRVLECNVLVNNAGGALGLEPVIEGDEDKWRTMWESNVLGTMLMTRELAPKLIASGDGHIINMASVAAFMTYIGGGGYSSSKHAVHAVNDSLRKELLGKPVRVTEIDPGMVETEFSITRFDGDKAKADQVYADMTPLSAEDIADCVVWCASRPSHVNIDRVVIAPRDQVAGGDVHRHK